MNDNDVDTSYPPIASGSRVRTTRENPELSGSWTKEALEHRRWGVTGTVLRHHDSHGSCYDVLHDDGGWSGYDPSELEVLK